MGKDLHCYKKKLFQINAVLLTFLFIKESWKKLSVSTKKLNSTAVMYIYNNNNFSLSIIRMISEGSCDTEESYKLQTFQW